MKFPFLAMALLGAAAFASAESNPVVPCCPGPPTYTVYGCWSNGHGGTVTCPINYITYIDVQLGCADAGQKGVSELVEGGIPGGAFTFVKSDDDCTWWAQACAAHQKKCLVDLYVKFVVPTCGTDANGNPCVVNQYSTLKLGDITSIVGVNCDPVALSKCGVPGKCDSNPPRIYKAFFNCIQVIPGGSTERN